MKQKPFRSQWHARNSSHHKAYAAFQMQVNFAFTQSVSSFAAFGGVPAALFPYIVHKMSQQTPQQRLTWSATDLARILSRPWQSARAMEPARWWPSHIGLWGWWFRCTACTAATTLQGKTTEQAFAKNSEQRCEKKPEQVFEKKFVNPGQACWTPVLSPVGLLDTLQDSDTINTLPTVLQGKQPMSGEVVLQLWTDVSTPTLQSAQKSSSILWPLIAQSKPCNHSLMSRFSGVPVLLTALAFRKQSSVLGHYTAATLY